MVHKKTIKKLNIFLRNFFNLNYNPLTTTNSLNYKLEGIYDAINYRHKEPEKVKTIPFFDDFYVYIEVKFTRDYKDKFISVSVFQGAKYDKRKNQLFRAEWDDYADDRDSHPQPHWHITRGKAHENRFNDLVNNKIEEESISLDLFNLSNESVFDTKKMHFAMSGLWHYNDEGHIHKFDDADKIVNWMRGLLEHVKYELES